MKKTSLAGTSALFASLFFINMASAMVPTLGVQNTIDDNYLLNIYGDPNQTATLYYHTSSNPSAYTTLSLGNTSSSGNLQYTLDLSNYNVVANDNIYVAVNGQNSSTNTVGYNNYNNSYNSNEVTVDVGEIMNIPIIPVSGNVTITHTNSNIASATQNGNSIDVKGLVQGTDTVTVSGVTSNGQTIPGTLVVTVKNVVQNTTQNGNIFARNFQRFFQTQKHNKVTKVKNYRNFWDKKTHVVHGSFHR